MATDGRRKRGGRQRGQGASRRRPQQGELDKVYLEALKDVQGEEGELSAAAAETEALGGPSGEIAHSGRSLLGEQQQAWGGGAGDGGWFRGAAAGAQSGR